MNVILARSIVFLQKYIISFVAFLFVLQTSTGKLCETLTLSFHTILNVISFSSLKIDYRD